MRIVAALLVAALVVAIAALALSLQHSASLRAQLAEEGRWRAGIVRQLQDARRVSGRTAPLDPQEAGEALAEIIASRDSAAQILSHRGEALPADPSALPPLPTGLPTNIATLSGRESTGVAGDDAAAIERDSQTPWTGWK